MSYGKAAILAIDIANKFKVGPEEAWRRAVVVEFPGSTSSQAKGCPKAAFLGLCGEGLVKRIPVGNYTRSQRNKRYALNAAKVLSSGKKFTSTELWKEVMTKESDRDKAHNHQMTVVLALWERNLLNI